MNIAIRGCRHKTDTPDEFTEVEPGNFLASHSACSSSLALVRQFRKAGWKAEMKNRPGSDDDVVFVNEHNFFTSFIKQGFWSPSRPTFLWLHSAFPGKELNGKRLTDLCLGICFTRKEALDTFRARWGDHNYWVAPWGFPDWWDVPPRKTNPYPEGTVNAIYAGRIERGGNIIRLLKGLAEDRPALQIHVIAPIKEDVGKELGGIKNIFLYGARNHGSFLNYIHYADVALDTGIVTNKEANNCKLWDYLAMGTPVVMDGTTGGDELIKTTGNGIIVPRLDFSAYVDAVDKVLMGGFPRRETIEYMQTTHRWDRVIDAWIIRIKESLEGR